MMLEQAFNLLHANNVVPLIMAASAYFLLIYLLFSFLATLIAIQVKRPISTIPFASSQVRTEILRSIRSIMLFGAGMILPWAMLKFGFARISIDANLLTIILECVLLVLWNDLHFYGMHRLMHYQFRRAHGVHHQSIVSTPFASYSMSVTEALILGSVLPLAMLLHSFSLQALLFLPVWSILINALAHSNCDLFINSSANTLLGFIKHHQNHHSYYQGNYSFFFPQFDRWFGTEQTAKGNK